MRTCNRKYLLLPALYVFFLFAGCSSETVLTSEQRQALQSRFFTGVTYKDLFQIIVDMLKRSGYQTTQVDAEQGVIVGTIRSNTPETFTTRFGRDSHRALREGERMEALFNVKAVDAENVGVRLSLQQLPEYSLGVVHGEELHDPQSYQRFFNHLQALVKKHAALKAKNSQP